MVSFRKTNSRVTPKKVGLTREAKEKLICGHKTASKDQGKNQSGYDRQSKFCGSKRKVKLGK